MKKYLIFILSFALLFTITQVISGMALTALYTPDLTLTNTNLSQEITFGERQITAWLVPLIAASLAFFVTQKVARYAKI